jgi:uncharacterized delta-60 repeat protein
MRRLLNRIASGLLVAAASVSVAQAAGPFNPGANGDVLAIAVQPDGKILVGGDFTALGGGTGTTARNNIGRLNADGSVDTSFNPGADDIVWAFVVQPDGKIVVGGEFSTLGGATRRRLGRLNADGSIDTTFNPGVDSSVRALARQSDGRLVVGGRFTMLGGGGTGTTARKYIGRLTADGSLDTTFNPGADYDVRALAVQADGRILAGGFFSMLGGGTGTTARNGIGRLNADGSVDPTFNPNASGLVRTIVPQSDGRILVGGDFITMGGAARRRLARLNADGSVDAGFTGGAGDPATASSTSYEVHTLAVQSDGKVIVGGSFPTLWTGGRVAAQHRSPECRRIPGLRVQSRHQRQRQLRAGLRAGGASRPQHHRRRRIRVAGRHGSAPHRTPEQRWIHRGRPNVRLFALVVEPLARGRGRQRLRDGCGRRLERPGVFLDRDRGCILADRDRRRQRDRAGHRHLFGDRQQQ